MLPLRLFLAAWWIMTLFLLKEAILAASRNEISPQAATNFGVKNVNLLDAVLDSFNAQLLKTPQKCDNYSKYYAKKAAFFTKSSSAVKPSTSPSFSSSQPSVVDEVDFLDDGACDVYVVDGDLQVCGNLIISGRLFVVTGMNVESLLRNDSIHLRRRCRSKALFTTRSLVLPYADLVVSGDIEVGGNLQASSVTADAGSSILVGARGIWAGIEFGGREGLGASSKPVGDRNERGGGREVIGEDIAAGVRVTKAEARDEGEKNFRSLKSVSSGQDEALNLLEDKFDRLPISQSGGKAAKAKENALLEKVGEEAKPGYVEVVSSEAGRSSRTAGKGGGLLGELLGKQEKSRFPATFSSDKGVNSSQSIKEIIGEGDPKIPSSLSSKIEEERVLGIILHEISGRLSTCIDKIFSSPSLDRTTISLQIFKEQASTNPSKTTLPKLSLKTHQIPTCQQDFRGNLDKKSPSSHPLQEQILDGVLLPSNKVSTREFVDVSQLASESSREAFANSSFFPSSSSSYDRNRRNRNGKSQETLENLEKTDSSPESVQLTIVFREVADFIKHRRHKISEATVLTANQTSSEKADKNGLDPNEEIFISSSGSNSSPASITPEIPQESPANLKPPQLPESAYFQDSLLPRNTTLTCHYLDFNGKPHIFDDSETTHISQRVGRRWHDINASSHPKRQETTRTIPSLEETRLERTQKEKDHSLSLSDDHRFDGSNLKNAGTSRRNSGIKAEDRDFPGATHSQEKKQVFGQAEDIANKTGSLVGDQRRKSPPPPAENSRREHGGLHEEGRDKGIDFPLLTLADQLDDLGIGELITEQLNISNASRVIVYGNVISGVGIVLDTSGSLYSLCGQGYTEITDGLGLILQRGSIASFNGPQNSQFYHLLMTESSNFFGRGSLLIAGIFQVERTSKLGCGGSIYSSAAAVYDLGKAMCGGSFDVLGRLEVGTFGEIDVGDAVLAGEVQLNEGSNMRVEGGLEASNYVLLQGKSLLLSRRGSIKAKFCHVSNQSELSLLSGDLEGEHGIEVLSSVVQVPGGAIRAKGGMLVGEISEVTVGGNLHAGGGGIFGIREEDEGGQSEVNEVKVSSSSGEGGESVKGRSHANINSSKAEEEANLLKKHTVKGPVGVVSKKNSKSSRNDRRMQSKNQVWLPLKQASFNGGLKKRMDVVTTSRKALKEEFEGSFPAKNSVLPAPEEEEEDATAPKKQSTNSDTSSTSSNDIGNHGKTPPPAPFTPSSAWSQLTSSSRARILTSSSSSAAKNWSEVPHTQRSLNLAPSQPGPNRISSEQNAMLSSSLEEEEAESEAALQEDEEAASIAEKVPALFVENSKLQVYGDVIAEDSWVGFSKLALAEIHGLEGLVALNADVFIAIGSSLSLSLGMMKLDRDLELNGKSSLHLPAGILSANSFTMEGSSHAEIEGGVHLMQDCLIKGESQLIINQGILAVYGSILYLEGGDSTILATAVSQEAGDIYVEDSAIMQSLSGDIQAKGSIVAQDKGSIISACRITSHKGNIVSENGSHVMAGCPITAQEGVIRRTAESVVAAAGVTSLVFVQELPEYLIDLLGPSNTYQNMKENEDISLKKEPENAGNPSSSSHPTMKPSELSIEEQKKKAIQSRREKYLSELEEDTGSSRTTIQHTKNQITPDFNSNKGSIPHTHTSSESIPSRATNKQENPPLNIKLSTEKSVEDHKEYDKEENSSKNTPQHPSSSTKSVNKYGEDISAYQPTIKHDRPVVKLPSSPEEEVKFYVSRKKDGEQLPFEEYWAQMDEFVAKQQETPLTKYSSPWEKEKKRYPPRLNTHTSTAEDRGSREQQLQLNKRRGEREDSSVAQKRGSSSGTRDKGG